MLVSPHPASALQRTARPSCHHERLPLTHAASKPSPRTSRLLSPKASSQDPSGPPGKDKEDDASSSISTISRPPVPSALPVLPRRRSPKHPTADKFTGTRSFLEIASNQAFDSVVDIGRHLERSNKQLPGDAAQDKLVRDGGKLRLQKSKPVVLVLGSGWGAHSLIKVIDTDIFDVVLVSPRNHFLFTPMLPSTAVGTVEFRSLVEPIRTSNEFVSYFEASCDKIDTKGKVATCTAAFEYEDGLRPTFEVPYDILVVSVGEQVATFGVPGVKEHCMFMKEITDTIAMRNNIGKCFELAALPGTTDEDRSRALHFVVVGGGPTGVEFAGTLSDFLRGDLQRKYPSLMRYVRVTLLQSAQSILTQFDSNLGQRALENLENTGVTVRTGVRVVGVTQKQVLLKGGETLEYGLCLWSCGNAAWPLVQQLVEATPAQMEAQRPGAPSASYKLVVDPFLRVIGAKDIIAIGDCSRVVSGALPPTAQVAGQQGSYVAHVINEGYVFGRGGMSETVPRKLVNLGQWRLLGDKLVQGMYAVAGPQKHQQLEVPSAEDTQLYASSSSLGGTSVATALLSAAAAARALRASPAAAAELAIGTTAVQPERTTWSISQGSGGSMGSIELDGNSYDMMTAAVASPDAWLDYCTRPFEFLSLGIMAYVGDDKALTQIGDEGGLKLYGSFAFLLWRSVYITKQVSLRNRVLILFDWLKTRVFGRDTSIF